jgi:hypothetical protein
VCDGRYRAFTIHCGVGARVFETWQEAQLEPNTLIEAKARAEALRLETFESEEEGGKFVITLFFFFSFFLFFFRKEKEN